MKLTRYHRYGLPNGASCFRAQLVLAACILCMMCLLFLQLDVPHGFRDRASPVTGAINTEGVNRPFDFHHNSSRLARTEAGPATSTHHRSTASPLHETRTSAEKPRATHPTSLEAKTTISGSKVNWTFDYTPQIRPTLCQTQNGRCNFTEPVVICVSSCAGQFERRQAVRKTWSTWPGVRALFFFGANESFQTRLIEEAAQYNDIVQYDFLDTYANLTLKSVSMLRFVSLSKWDKLKFFIKSDDDTFINVRLLEKVLAAIKRPGIFGNVQKGARPKRQPKDKWYVSKEEFPDNIFPPYVTGCFYIIPINQTLRMSEHATDLRLLRFEDTYITGLLAKKLNIPRYAVPVAGVDWTGSKRRMQDVVRFLIAKHYVQPVQMIKMFAYMNDPTDTIALISTVE